MPNLKIHPAAENGRIVHVTPESGRLALCGL